MEFSLIILATGTVVLLEVVPWLLFKRKMSGIQFPHKLDTSFFGFFTMARVRILVILHAIFLLIVLLLGFVFLW